MSSGRKINSESEEYNHFTDKMINDIRMILDLFSISLNRMGYNYRTILEKVND